MGGGYGAAGSAPPGGGVAEVALLWVEPEPTVVGELTSPERVGIAIRDPANHSGISVSYLSRA
jgi:hypothetical protein